MPTLLTVKAAERSTYIVSAAFTDDEGVEVTPDSITWTLTDDDGSVINSRLNVAVAMTASSIDIVLSGSDLALQLNESGDVIRVLKISAVYTSDAGSNLPLIDDARFILQDIVAVS